MKRHFDLPVFNLVAIFTLFTGPLYSSCIGIDSNRPALQEATELAFANSMQLKEVDARVQMKLAECWQAGLCPNPAFLFELNQFDLPNKRRSFDQVQASFEISQLLELGNKRSARQNVMAAESSIILWEAESIRQALIKRVSDTYVDAITAQRKLDMLSDLHDNGSKILDCIAQKVQNGKISPILQRKSVLNLHTVNVEQKKTAALLATSKRQLELLCGDTFDFNALRLEPLPPLTPPLPIENYLNLIYKNSEIAQLEATQLAAHYNYHLQRSNRIPNLVVSAGVNQYSPCSNYQLSFGLGFEIPIFNRNQGSISRSQWEEYSVFYKILDLEKQLKLRCEELYAEWIRLYETLELIQEELIPSTLEMLQIHSDREVSGKEDCLERLEENKNLYDLQLQYIDALHDFHHLKANMRLLCGMDFEMLD